MYVYADRDSVCALLQDLLDQKRHGQLVLQRKVRLKAAVLGGVLLENSCAGDGAGSNFAL